MKNLEEEILPCRKTVEKWSLTPECMRRCRVEQSMITNNVVHRCMRADLAGATNANVHALTRCGREFLLRFLFPFREGVARRLLLGMWKDDGRGGGEEVKDTSWRDSDSGLLKKGIRCGTSRPRSRWSLIVGVNFASKDVSIPFQPFARAKDTGIQIMDHIPCALSRGNDPRLITRLLIVEEVREIHSLSV